LGNRRQYIELFLKKVHYLMLLKFLFQYFQHYLLNMKLKSFKFQSFLVKRNESL